MSYWSSADSPRAGRRRRPSCSPGACPAMPRRGSPWTRPRSSRSRPGPGSCPAAARSSRTRSRRSGSTWRARTASTSGRPPAGSRTACSRRGAARVCALDVGYGQLDSRLRNDPRVTVMERRNVREIAPEELPFAPVVPRVRRLVHRARQGAAARARLRGARLARARAREAAVRGRARRTWGRAASSATRRCIAACCRRSSPPRPAGARIRGPWSDSGLPGPKGNREFFLYLTQEPDGAGGVDDAAIDAAIG